MPLMPASPKAWMTYIRRQGRMMACGAAHWINKCVLTLRDVLLKQSVVCAAQGRSLRCCSRNGILLHIAETGCTAAAGTWTLL
jgi:hypothetical protein